MKVVSSDRGKSINLTYNSNNLDKYLYASRERSARARARWRMAYTRARCWSVRKMRKDKRHFVGLVSVSDDLTLRVASDNSGVVVTQFSSPLLASSSP